MPGPLKDPVLFSVAASWWEGYKSQQRLRAGSRFGGGTEELPGDRRERTQLVTVETRETELSRAREDIVRRQEEKELRI